MDSVMLSREEIGSRFQEAFGDRSLAEVGGILGVRKSTVWSWIHGRTLPEGDTLQRICVEFGVSADYLFGLSDQVVGHRLDLGGVACIQVPKISDVRKAALRRFEAEDIVGPMPFTEDYIRTLIGRVPDDPWQLIVVTMEEHTGQMADLLIDRKYMDLTEGRAYVVEPEEGKVSVGLLHSKGQVHVFTRDHMPPAIIEGEPLNYVIGKVLVAFRS
jgi:transcriptional regulator with XRE-family HTH domain